MPREVLEGLLAIEPLRRQHSLKGVAGCLVDLLEVPPQLVAAAEVVAGNQLFQVRRSWRLVQERGAVYRAVAAVCCVLCSSAQLAEECIVHLMLSA